MRLHEQRRCGVYDMHGLPLHRPRPACSRTPRRTRTPSRRTASPTGIPCAASPSARPLPPPPRRRRAARPSSCSRPCPLASPAAAPTQTPTPVVYPWKPSATTITNGNTVVWYGGSSFGMSVGAGTTFAGAGAGGLPALRGLDGCPWLPRVRRAVGRQRVGCRGQCQCDGHCAQRAEHVPRRTECGGGLCPRRGGGVGGDLCVLISGLPLLHSQHLL
ncbi:hypothetical protein PHLGIDRAFT_285838 [Phlebiopsis gigantea 11061_1 CR5-6]|uniref:Uncharacterized protein n=1 Tax=Phlebiopsis gigantea (strain 11061_1 CR5-6) TaxID=745531 RepID=A0A0C3RRC7_PHLG1|nr:hypothetical protein PHLGIDRAFT_285838 [Phlebiopsis gigantea 11061_1 CR5-6]